MSEAEQKALLGELLYEQRQAERQAACYRVKAIRVAEALERAATTIRHTVKANQSVVDHTVIGIAEIAYPADRDAIEVLRHYGTHAKLAQQRTEQLEAAAP